MKRSKFWIVIACIMLLVLSSACSANQNTQLLDDANAPNASTTTSESQYQIALVMKTLTNPFFVEMEKGAREAENELNVKLIVKTGAQETSIEQQIQIVEELILQQVDAIVIAPGSSVDLVKVLKKAQDAGIIIVNIDNRLDIAECEKQGLKNVPFISVKNDDAAYLSAKSISDQINSPAEAAIIEGIREAENAELRRQGAVKAFSENANITVVSSESANWKIDEANNSAKKIFEAYPNIKLVFCANDMMALGVIQYLQEADISGVLVAGVDDLDDMKAAIKSGWAYATINQQADLQGYTGIVTAVNMLKGLTVEPVTYVEAKLVTAETLK